MFKGAISQELDGKFCFLAGTPVVTDQGEIAIEKITSKNTINGMKVKEVVSYRNADNFMILIKKGALGENSPNKDTLISQNHRVFIGSKPIMAKKLINHTTIVRKFMVPEIVYNVLLDKPRKKTMSVNNLIVETKDPDMIGKVLPRDFDWRVYAKLHKDLSNLNKEQIENHYLRIGKKEGRMYKSEMSNRKVPNDFNWTTYISLHKDLKNLNHQQAVNHYIKFGRKENRVYKKLVSA